MQRPAAAADDDNDDDDGGASVPRTTLRLLPPLFPVSMWTVHVPTLNGDDRTNNQCEAWNRGFAALVGHNHASIIPYCQLGKIGHYAVFLHKHFHSIRGIMPL